MVYSRYEDVVNVFIYSSEGRSQRHRMLWPLNSLLQSMGTCEQGRVDNGLWSHEQR